MSHVRVKCLDAGYREDNRTERDELPAAERLIFIRSPGALGSTSTSSRVHFDFVAEVDLSYDRLNQSAQQHTLAGVPRGTELDGT